MTQENVKRILQELNIRRLRLYIEARPQLSSEVAELMNVIRTEFNLEDYEDHTAGDEYLAVLHADIERDTTTLKDKERDAKRITFLVEGIDKANERGGERNAIKAQTLNEVLMREKYFYKQKWGVSE